MVKHTFLITSEYGLHARPATKLVHLAMSFDAEIELETDGKSINLKSIMGLMSLGVYKGEEIVITAIGSDEVDAMEHIKAFISSEQLGKEK